MADNDATLQGSVNLGRLRGVLSRLTQGVGVALGSRTIENYLRDKTKARFEPRGSNPFAQRNPQGQFWPFLAKATVERKRRDGLPARRSHALYGRGVLQRSIQILKKLPGMVAIQAGGNHYFEIGVRPTSPAAKYAQFQLTGGTTPRGGRVPSRVFIGVSKQDADTIGLNVKAVILDKLR